MIKEKLLEYYKSHYGEINGALIGFLSAVLMLIIGFFKVLFIAVFVVIGYYVGKNITSDKDYIKKLLDKILPPGKYR